MEASDMSEKEKNTNQLLSILKDLFNIGKPKGISSYELDDARTPEERKQVFDRHSKK